MGGGNRDEFDHDYVQRLAAARSHWWVEGMRAVGQAILGDTERGLDVLDAGCGAGTNLDWARQVAAGGSVSAIDVSWPAVARSSSLPGPGRVCQASLDRLPFHDGSFDAVLCLDVLQHLPRDAEAAALDEIHRVLRPGGWVLLRTGAKHGRRRVAARRDWRLYDLPSLTDQLVAAGLAVRRATAANFVGGLWASLPRPRALLSRQHHDNGHHDHDHDHDHHDHDHHDDHGLGIPPPVASWRNALQRRVMAFEARWLERPGRTLPFGHSLYVWAVRVHATAHDEPDPDGGDRS